MIEIDRIDWGAYECRCGERGHVGQDLRRIISARSVAEMGGVTLAGHVEDQAMLAPVAVPATGVIMAALQEELSADTRDELMLTLWRVVLGEDDESVKTEIYDRVRDGIWTLYREATRGDTEAVLDILEYVEHDGARLEHFRRAVAPRLAKRTR
ncbi:hypothetical protein [Streptomyces vietnamensis]|uniref:Uncharacterized protein n=1 Tax=Streptomyces vietnamensis TaxID=362257 RepID=A0A0B5I357_9ACTN|nr:hypothetical protein [Streptomyces vietnamensis]AJF64043.1 hypothetical protein SVTN_06065 [Streptomyces vietnamensis]